MNIQKLFRFILFAAPGVALLAVLGSWSLLGVPGALITLAGLLVLGLGFLFTALVVAGVTGAWSLQPWQIAAAFFGKTLWWLSLFLGSKSLPKGSEPALAWAIGAYILLFFAASIFGQRSNPKVDAPQDP
jgi:hypothetical protein